jgi:TPR repeat protein
MLRTLVVFLCVCFAAVTSAKLGETVPELAKRFGKSYKIEQTQPGKTYKFRSGRIRVDVVVANGVSVSETYLSDHPLTASGEPPNDIVRAILRTNVPKARWGEVEAVSFGADYALRSSDGAYVAILKYTGTQPENAVWIMTVGLRSSVRRSSGSTTASVTPPTSRAFAPQEATTSPTPLPATAGTAQAVSSPSPHSHFDEMKRKAELGEAESQYQVGLSYYKGDGVGKDFSEAVKWYRKAAEQGLAVAQGALARCYYTGEGVSKDSAEIVNWSRKAAEQGDAVGQNLLGMAYYYGQGVAKDAGEGVNWFRKAAEQGYAKAKGNLGLAYFQGEGVPKDITEAINWFRKSAEDGAPNGQLFLGLAYEHGTGVPNDFGEAAKWIRKAAEQGASRAESELGALYFQGRGMPKDFREAVRWSRKAVEQGDSVGQTNLGLAYYLGNGVPKSFSDAVKWFRLAAEQRLGKSQFMLGVLYARGEGVSKSFSEAAKWYRKAAEQGEADAQCNLGVLYSRGEGVTKDFAEAVMWYRKAAEGGNVQAQSNLGSSYARGEGVPKNDVEAYKWWLLAAAKGNESAKNNVALVEGKMTRDEIAEGQKLAREFTPHAGSFGRAEASTVGAVEARPKGAGTGFFITKDGYLITNEHVAGNGADVRLVTSDGVIPAKMVKSDAFDDLALLKAQGTFEPLPVITTRSVKLGDSVATIGFPNIVLQGFAPKFAHGEIASLSGSQDDARFFQISVPVQPGNSGGPLVDEQGNVIGVVCAKLNAKAALLSSGALPENVNYAIKGSFLLGFLESVPELTGKLKEPIADKAKFADVVEQARKATVLVLVYSGDVDVDKR